jgi:glycerophosphoryl diester phosphodiesterase
VSVHAFPPEAFPEIVAHRGSPVTRPENTLASFEEAIRLGARIVEFDVRLTADRVPVVIHDATVDRTTDGSGAVDALTVDELGRLDAGDGDRVPTLPATLEAISGHAAVAIEIKNLPGEPGYDARGEPIVAAVHDALATTRFDGPVLVISFNPRSIAASKAIDASIPTGFLTNRLVPPDDALAHAVEAGHEMILPGTRSLLPAGSAFVGRAHAAGVRVGTWTADDPDEVRTLLSMGVDAIASNDPATALAVLRDV